MRTTLETSGTILTPQHSNHRVPEEDIKKDHEKILDEIIVENFPKMGKENSHKSKNPRVSQTV